AFTQGRCTSCLPISVRTACCSSAAARSDIPTVLPPAQRPTVWPSRRWCWHAMRVATSGTRGPTSSRKRLAHVPRCKPRSTPGATSHLTTPAPTHPTSCQRPRKLLEEIAMRLTQGTFSFLPDLTDEQITAQIEYCLKQGWAVSIEYTDD